MPTVNQFDDSGTLAVSGSTDAVNEPTALGFGPNLRRYLTAGLYNGEFATPTLDTSQVIDATNNPLPYWNVAYSATGANSITAQWLADTASASGGVVRFVMTGASLVGDEMFLEQLIPLNSSRSQDWSYWSRLVGNVTAKAGSPALKATIDWLQSDGSTATGTGASTTSNAVVSLQTVICAPTGAQAPPANAAFARIRFGVRCTINGDSLTVDMTDAIAGIAVFRLGLTDNANPTTDGIGFVYQSGGAIVLVPDYTATGLPLTWDGTFLTFSSGGKTLENTSSSGRITANCDFRSNPGLLITGIHAGAVSDSDFVGGAANGGHGVDTTNNRWYARSGTWKSVAIAGERIPAQERRCPECLRLIEVGQSVVCVVNELYTDWGRHMFWQHRSCGWRWRLAKALRLVHPHTAWYTAAIRRVEARYLARHDDYCEAPERRNLRIVA